MHPIVQKFVAGQLPEPMAQALMAGSLPVPPQDLLEALAHAVFSEHALAPRALETLQGFPESLLQGAIAGHMENPAALALLCMHRTEPGLLEMALLHEDFTAEWMERAVPSLPSALLEVPLNNQVFWMERPAILDLIEAHPACEYNLKRRINEYRRDVLGQLSPAETQDRLEILDEVEAGALDPAWAELPPPKPEEQEEEAPEVLRERYLKPILDADGQEIPLRLAQRIMKLRTSQKILLAMKGGKEERTILIRESNRLIQVAVIRNGRVTEGEVAYIAQMRSLNEEVLRIISTNREWMKKYTIVKNLVLNPRTPVPLAMGMVKRLVEPDLKLLMRDKNVAELLRREAKRIMEGKTSGK